LGGQTSQVMETRESSLVTFLFFIAETLGKLGEWRIRCRNVSETLTWLWVSQFPCSGPSPRDCPFFMTFTQSEAVTQALVSPDKWGVSSLMQPNMAVPVTAS